MESLINILKRASNGLEEGWLYLPEGQTWNHEVEGVIIDIDELKDSEIGEDEEPLVAKDKGLVCTLDSATIEDIVLAAQDLKPVLTNELLFESFRYYYDNDAFLPEPGFKPLPNDELMLKIDRGFYDCLGNERKEVQCRNNVCERGAIEGSVYCKIHHFEMMQKKPCPFTD
jgi:hypothetical protein